MSPAPLAQHYCVEKSSVMNKSNVMGMQNIVGKYNNEFAKGAG